MTNAVAVQSNGAVAPRFTPDQIDLIKRQICKGSDDQLRLFMYQCERTGLDPFVRQIYAVMRGTNMTIQTSIDGFRLIAQRTGEYEGQVGPQWCGKDGQWQDVWLASESPVAARVGVWRTGFRDPCWGVARFDAYAQKYGGKLADMWAKMGDVMIAKCAEALALRKAFPQELSGVYTGDEMDQAESTKSAYRARKDGDWETLIAEMNEQPTVEKLKAWVLTAGERIAALPENWKEHLREAYARRLAELANGGDVKEQLRASVEHNVVTGEIIEPKKRQRSKDAPNYGERAQEPAEDQPIDPDLFLDGLDMQFASANSAEDLAAMYQRALPEIKTLLEPDRKQADAILEKHRKRLEG